MDKSTADEGGAERPAYQVGVYYYPWHGGNFHGGRYLRRHLEPPQTPELGEYDDRDAAVIGQHLAWSRQAGVSFWAASWWGPDRREDRTLRDHIMPHRELDGVKIAVHYETTGRTDNFSDYSRLGPDMEHLAAHYFGHPNYLRVDNKPVIFVYLTRVLGRRGTLASSLEEMRRAAGGAGYELFIVGDHVFGRQPSAGGDMALLDAVTNYDVYGSMGAQGFAGQGAVDAYYAAQGRWKEAAAAVGVPFVPAVTPGFNDKGVRQGHVSVAGRLSPDDEAGSLFRAMLRGALPLTNEGLGRMLMVTSWNEWHEDTQIEPVAPAPITERDDSDSGAAFTEGLPYEGYGELYLNILRQETAE